MAYGRIDRVSISLDYSYLILSILSSKAVSKVLLQAFFERC